MIISFKATKLKQLFFIWDKLSKFIGKVHFYNIADIKTYQYANKINMYKHTPNFFLYNQDNVFVPHIFCLSG